MSERYPSPDQPENNPQGEYFIKRITLPSGKLLEVLSFNVDEQNENSGLHVCSDCKSDLVQPIEWNEVPNPDFWHLVLECPNCWGQQEGIFHNDRVWALEDKLDEGHTAILDDLRRLTQANMSEEIERFSAALQADQILPEDF